MWVSPSPVWNDFVLNWGRLDAPGTVAPLRWVIKKSLLGALGWSWRFVAFRGRLLLLYTRHIRITTHSSASIKLSMIYLRVIAFLFLGRASSCRFVA
jgi:hypothetical protein